MDGNGNSVRGAVHGSDDQRFSQGLRAAAGSQCLNGTLTIVGRVRPESCSIDVQSTVAAIDRSRRKTRLTRIRIADGQGATGCQWLSSVFSDRTVFHSANHCRIIINRSHIKGQRLYGAA